MDSHTVRHRQLPSYFFLRCRSQFSDGRCMIGRETRMLEAFGMIGRDRPIRPATDCAPASQRQETKEER